MFQLTIYEGLKFHDLQQFSASKRYIASGLQETGAANLVASVILDYRAYDTLGEVTVLFTCIMGALVILRKPSKKALDVIVPLYKKMLEVEKSIGVDASIKVWTDILQEKVVGYNQLIISHQNKKAI